MFRPLSFLRSLQEDTALSRKGDERTLFAASLVVSLLFISLTLYSHGLFQPFSEIESDDSYLPLAQNIYSIGVFTNSTTTPFRLETSHAPGYPFFLAFAAVPFGSIIPALLLQAILFAVSVVFLYRLVRGIFPREVAFGGSLLYGIEPFTGLVVTSVLSEALFLFLFLGSLHAFRVAFERGLLRVAILAGVTLSVSVLVRPIALYVTPLVWLSVLIFALHKRSLLPLVLGSLLIFLVPLSLWAARNHDAYGVWSLSTKGPYTVYFWDVGQLIEYREGWSALQAENYLLGRVREVHPDIISPKSLRYPQYAALLNRISFDEITSSPLLYAKLHLLSMGTFFLSDGNRLLVQSLGVPLAPLPNLTKALGTGQGSAVISYFADNPGTFVLFIIGFAFWSAVTALGFLAALLVWRKGEQRARRFFVVSFLLLVLAFAGFTGPVAQARYRIVVTPFLFVLAAWSAVALRERAREQRREESAA